MTERYTSGYGGHPWLYDKGTLTSIPNTVSAFILLGSWDLNNNGMFVYATDVPAYLHIASVTTGDQFVSSNKYYYTPDINDSNAVSCVRYESYNYYVKTSTDMGASFTTVSGAYMDYYSSAINNAGQIAYKYGG